MTTYNGQPLNQYYVASTSNQTPIQVLKTNNQVVNNPSMVSGRQVSINQQGGIDK